MPFNHPVITTSLMLALLGCAPGDDAGQPQAQRQAEAPTATHRLYRGIATRNTAAPTFVACGSTDTLRLLDSAAALSSLPLGTSTDPLFIVLSAQKTPDNEITLERVVYASKNRYKCYEDWSGFSYRATGSSPGWTAEIADTSVRLRREGDLSFEWNDLRKDSTADRIRFSASPAAGGSAFEMILEPRTGTQ